MISSLKDKQLRKIINESGILNKNIQFKSENLLVLILQEYDKANQDKLLK